MQLIQSTRHLKAQDTSTTNWLVQSTATSFDDMVQDDKAGPTDTLSPDSGHQHNELPGPGKASYSICPAEVYLDTAPALNRIHALQNSDLQQENVAVTLLPDSGHQHNELAGPG